MFQFFCLQQKFQRVQQVKFTVHCSLFTVHYSLFTHPQNTFSAIRQVISALLHRIVVQTKGAPAFINSLTVRRTTGCLRFDIRVGLIASIRSDEFRECRRERLSVGRMVTRSDRLQPRNDRNVNSHLFAFFNKGEVLRIVEEHLGHEVFGPLRFSTSASACRS